MYIPSVRIVPGQVCTCSAIGSLSQYQMWPHSGRFKGQNRLLVCVDVAEDCGGDRNAIQEEPCDGLSSQSARTDDILHSRVIVVLRTVADP